MKKLLIIMFGALLLVPTLIFADGMVMPGPDNYVRESDQNAAIFYKDNKEDMVLSVSYSGDAKDFAWIVPTPNKPTLNKVSSDFFTKLNKETQTKQKAYEVVQSFLSPSYYGGYSGAMDSNLSSGGLKATTSAPDSTVQVVEQKQVGPYNTTVLKSEKVDDLNTWLKDNNYNIVEASNTVIADYIKKDWYFVAMKISDDYQTSKTTGDLNTKTIAPIALSFQADKVIFPLRISSLNSNSNLITNDYKNYLADEFYYDLSGTYASSYMKKSKLPIFTEAYFNAAVEQEKSGTTIEDLKAKFLADVEKESADNLLKAQTYLYYQDNYGSDSQNGYQSLTLYMFSDKKLKSDNYSTDVEYASTLSKNKINEFLGKDFNIDKNYFVTKLVNSSLKLTDMKADMLFTEDSDQKAVNDGSMDLPEWLYTIILVVGAIIYFPFALAVKFGFGIGIVVVALIYLGAFIALTVEQFLNPDNKKRLVTILQAYILAPAIAYFMLFAVMTTFYGYFSDSSSSYWLPVSLFVISVLISYVIAMLLYLLAKRLYKNREMYAKTDQLLREHPEILSQLQNTVPTPQPVPQPNTVNIPIQTVPTPPPVPQEPQVVSQPLITENLYTPEVKPVEIVEPPVEEPKKVEKRPRKPKTDK